MNNKTPFYAVRTNDGFVGMDSVTSQVLIFQNDGSAERCRASFKCDSVKEIYLYSKDEHENARASGWIDACKNPESTGEYIVDSSFGVTTAYFQSTVSGQLYWQEAKTNTDEGCVMDDCDLHEFEVYAWMPMPEKYKGPRG